MSKSGALSANQTAVIAALLESRTVADAATKTHTPARTIYRWLLDPSFQTALRTAEENVIDEAVRRLLGMQQQALSALQVVLVARDTPPSARVAAARTVLDAMLKLRDHRTFEERLAAIESAMEGMGEEL